MKQIDLLSPRLRFAADRVRDGAVFADIGTDHAKLPIALVDAGKINEAENRLYEELERDEEGTFEVALGFYDYLNELPEEFLEEHDYSKEEVKEGAQSLADRKGLGLLGEGLD